MQPLGPKASLRRHEQDLLYAGAACQAHDHKEVNAVGDALLTEHKRLRALRHEYEDAEDGITIAEALRSARDSRRDKTLISMGQFADALGGPDRAKLFKLPPSRLAQLGYQAESAAIREILIKLAQYPADHPLRLAYQQRLSDEQAAFEQAASIHDEAEQRMVAVRFSVLNAKLENDTFRERQFGLLITLIGRAAASDVFKRWRTSGQPTAEATLAATQPPSDEPPAV
jgi:hypothetical protein